MLPDAIAGVRVEAGAHLGRIAGWTNRRGVAGVFWQHLERMLAGMPLCRPGRLRPSCRLGDPCPRDAWVGELAEFVLPEPDEASVVAIWNPR
ncbi:MAG: hypothetical protein U0838_00740 [Chloroflexota bacterium]